MEGSSKEKFFARNTLALLLISMEGRMLVVETKNESTIAGKLSHADGYGNLHMTNAKLTTITGKKCRYDEIHVRGSSVRYAHLPDDVDQLKALRSELTKKPRPVQMPKKYSKT